MVTLAASDQSFDVFPNETQLTDAIFAAFNKHTDTLLNLLDKHQRMEEPFADSVQMIKDRGGYSRDRKAQYVDPSNTIMNFMHFYDDPELEKGDRVRLEPLKNELMQAIADEKKRSPASWSLPPTIGNMISLLKSNPAVTELFNETQVRR